MKTANFISIFGSINMINFPSYDSNLETNVLGFGYSSTTINSLVVDEVTYDISFDINLNPNDVAATDNANE